MSRGKKGFQSINIWLEHFHTEIQIKQNQAFYQAVAVHKPGFQTQHQPLLFSPSLSSSPSTCSMSKGLHLQPGPEACRSKTIRQWSKRPNSRNALESWHLSSQRCCLRCSQSQPLWGILRNLVRNLVGKIFCEKAFNWFRLKAKHVWEDLIKQERNF